LSGRKGRESAKLEKLDEDRFFIFNFSLSFMPERCTRLPQPPRGGMSGVDEHAVFDGEASWRHDLGGGVRRLVWRRRSRRLGRAMRGAAVGESCKLVMNRRTPRRQHTYPFVRPEAGIVLRRSSSSWWEATNSKEKP
jgi:hypothetical protein